MDKDYKEVITWTFVAETWPLSTSTEEKCRDRIWGEKVSLYWFARERRPERASAFKAVPPLWEESWVVI